jgi:hypothetical protein
MVRPMMCARSKGGTKIPRRLFVLLVSAGVCSATAITQEMPVPVDVQASLLPKILSFQRLGPQGRNDNAAVGIVYQPQVRSSFVCANEIAEQLPRFLRNSDGSASSCVMIEYVSLSDLSHRIADEAVSMVYVAPLRSVDISELAKMLENRHLLSFTGVPLYVEEGLMLGVEIAGNHPKIVVNLSVARAAGVEFSSQLLKLSRVIE